MFRGILLDLDGTLVDSRATMARAIRDVLQELGIEPPEPKVLHIRVRHEPPRTILKSFGVSSLKEYWKSYVSRMSLSQPYLPNLARGCEVARAVGRSLGIVTSLPEFPARAILRQLRVDPFLSTLVTYGTTRRHKPSGDPILAAIDRLELPPDLCVYIGDQPEDILAGKDAGVSTAAALWGFGEAKSLIQLKPDFVFQRPTELLDFISIDEPT